MYALCLAAGKGTRFGDLGSYLQKCMYPIGVRPFLEYSIRNLLRSRVCVPGGDAVVLVVGHFADQIRAYFGGRYEGMDIVYVEQADQLGTAHAVHAADLALSFDEPVVAWLADLYVPPSAFSELRSNRFSTVLTLSGDYDGHAQKDVSVAVDGERVVRCWKGGSDLYDVGLWKLAPEVMPYMGPGAVEPGEERRVLPCLQRAVDDRVPVGHVRAREWLHLGGTEPSVEENILAVSRRLRDAERAYGCI